MKLLPIIQGMEERGVTFSRERTKQLKTRLKEESDCSRNICLSLADGLEGTELDELPKNGRSNALNDVIFKGFKLESPKKTEKGNPSMDKYVMEHWLLTLPRSSPAYHFVKNLAQYRKRQTAIGYIDSYEKFVVNDRIHSSLNPTGTSTLRFSSSNPNSQQIGKIEEANVRYCFGPAKGRVWYSLDYENLELRLTAYASKERVMIELFERPDDPPCFGSYHLMNASIIYEDLFNEMVCPDCAGTKSVLKSVEKMPCPCVSDGKYVGKPKMKLCNIKGAFKKRYEASWYKHVKGFGFALSYGALLASGTADRAARRPGAQAMVQNRLKEHTKLNDKLIAMASKLGYVETMPDKTVDPTRGYPIYCQRGSWGKVSPTVPLNYYIQSTACQCASKALIRCDKRLREWTRNDPRGYYVTMYVHDELGFDFPEGDHDDKAREIRAIMEQSGEDIGVPLKVSITRHEDNWSEGKSVY